MTGVLQPLLRVSAGGALTCLVILAATALLRNKLPKSWQCWLWVVALVRFLIPLTVNLPLPAPVAWAQPLYDAVSGIGSTATSAADTTAGLPTVGSITPELSLNTAAPAVMQHAVLDVGKAAVIIWISGAAIALTLSVAGYLISMRKLRQKRVQAKGGRVPVYESECVTTPLLAGLFRPAIYLPKGFENPELAIHHELCHLKRGDLWLKWAIQLAVCIHWFNPFVYLLKHEFSRLSELSCDCAVVRGLDDEARSVYGEMILSTVRSVSDFRGPMITALGKDKRLLKERIQEIMKRQAISKKAKAAMAVLIAVVLCAAVISCAKPTISGGTEAKSGAAGLAAKTVAYSAASANPGGFVNDPEVLGTWTMLTSANSISGFDPTSKSNPALPQGIGGDMIFAANGKTNTPGLLWSKGVIAASYRSLAFSYTIRDISGTKYLFIQHFGSASEFTVFRRTSDVTSFDLTTDDINLPFVNDPSVLGTWNKVDFVKDISNFDPAKKSWTGSDYLLQLAFTEGGKIVGTTTQGKGDTRFSWTKGAVIDPMYSTASAYTIKEIGGKTYMFYEWKSGDYVYRHMKPYYYVLQKAN